jgi:hypothetical protein
VLIPQYNQEDRKVALSYHLVLLIKNEVMGGCTLRSTCFAHHNAQRSCIFELVYVFKKYPFRESCAFLEHFRYLRV